MVSHATYKSLYVLQRFSISAYLCRLMVKPYQKYLHSLVLQIKISSGILSFLLYYFNIWNGVKISEMNNSWVLKSHPKTGIFNCYTMWKNTDLDVAVLFFFLKGGLEWVDKVSLSMGSCYLSNSNRNSGRRPSIW